MKIEQAIRAQGYGGDIRPAMITHLALTTRVLKMRHGAIPAHMCLLGSPSAGKNYVLHVNLNLLPPEAYHVVDAGSPRALIYDDVDLRHKVLVFSEVDSLPSGEDNAAASAVRNLLQDHKLHYAVTVRDPETGEFTVRKVEKPGPTVLATTAIRRLGPQLDSRLLVVEIPEDQNQIRAALNAQAAIELDGIWKPDSAVIAYQHLIQTQAPWDVVVPFVKPLAEAMGRTPAATRVLRDFAKIVSLVKAVAVLRHAHRQRDAQGRIIAEIDDYAAVYGLISEAYEATTTGAGEGVRNVVEVVAAFRAKGRPLVRVLDVARRLKVSKATAWRYVQLAIKGGWLVNQEERRNRPADLTVGDPLPDTGGLPSPETISRADHPLNSEIAKPDVSERSVDSLSDGFTPGSPGFISGAQPETAPETAGGQHRNGSAGDGFAVSRFTGGGGKRGGDAKDPVQRLAHLNKGRASTPEDGHLAYLRRSAKSMDWPALKDGSGRIVRAGRKAWDRFLKTAPDDKIARAVAALKALEGEALDALTRPRYHATAIAPRKSKVEK